MTISESADHRTKNEPMAVVRFHQVQVRAYYLWQARGAGEGDALGDWLLAERNQAFTESEEALEQTFGNPV